MSPRNRCSQLNEADIQANRSLVVKVFRLFCKTNTIWSMSSCGASLSKSRHDDKPQGHAKIGSHRKNARKMELPGS